jgi:anthranilate synthase component II
MITLIDNYDSFTYNLVHFLGELGAKVKVYRNNVVTVEEVMAEQPSGIVLSPGPCDPDRAGICLDLVKRAAVENVPVLGVCLGHQTIGQVFGGKVVRAEQLMHGKTSRITHSGTSVFKGLPDNFVATRYHSLTIDPSTVPNTLEITATTSDGVIMGLSHKDLPLHGVQFHPESIASEHGHALLQNFLDLTTPDAKAAA